jgi:homoserine O-acetyltransferase
MSVLGPGKLVDTSKYFVVSIDSLGNGISLSPSNAGRDSLAIPRFTEPSVWDRQGKTAKSIRRKAGAVGQPSIDDCFLQMTTLKP